MIHQNRLKTTVKPVWDDHSWDHLKVVVLDRWLFYKAPFFRQVFSFYSHCECFVNNKYLLEERFINFACFGAFLKIKNVLSYY